VVSTGVFVRESVQLALDGLDTDFEITVPDDLCAVELDEAQIKQVISNIVLNAHEAMDGKGAVRVYCENVDICENDPLQIGKGRHVRISLEDQGIGIPEENLDKVFDPYFSTKERGVQKGMGLGLSICHSIVDRHGGLITLESELGVGTTFHLYLPAIEKAISAPKSIEERVLGEPVTGTERLLVMDDEEMIRALALSMLGRLGYDVTVAKDGAEAIEFYSNAKDAGRPFDAVILDLIVRSGMGGIETIQNLRGIDPAVRGIVATGHSNDPVVSNCREYGFRGALTKPHTLYEVSQVLRDVISEEKS
jgi:CheY-like chemotaxis protein